MLSSRNAPIAGNADASNNNLNIWSELNRRNVIRVGAAYLVASWVLIEVASVMFDAFGFPDFAIKLLIAGLALGLMPVLVLAWAYELTPEGVVRDTGSGRENPEHRHTARRLDQVTIAMILLALGVIVVQRFVLPQQVPRQAADDTSVVATDQMADQARSPGTGVPDMLSVAVLPFTNMSPDPENEYFSDGISEEILNVLAGVEGLKVASRTSAFSFKGTSKPIAEIASELGVANILEGSVRKQGSRVRITAQLIDAADDMHLWSSSYDRELTDIFAVQEEIATAITEALGDALGVATVRVAAPTQSLEAYEDFLKGRTLFYQRGQSLIPARESLKRAIALDPDFAEAWAVLAATALVAPSYIPVDANESTEEARTAALRARELDDTLAMPYAILGTQASFHGNQLEAERLLDAALERDPQHGSALLWRGLLKIGVGDLAAAETDLARAHQLEPMVGINNGWLGSVRMMLGDNDGGEKLLVRSVDLGWVVAGHLALARLALSRGNQSGMLDHLKEYVRVAPQPRHSSESRRVHEAWLAALEDPAAKPEFDEAVSRELEVSSGGRRGILYLFLGDFDKALELETLHPVAANAFKWQMWYPGFRSVVERPAFVPYAEQEGLMEYWQVKGFPNGCKLLEQPETRLECDW